MFVFKSGKTYIVPAIWEVDKWLLSSGNNHASPKFAIFGFKSLSRRMLAPLMSRCIMCGCKYSWRWMRPWTIPTQMLNRIVQSKNKTFFICWSTNTKMLTIINHKVLDYHTCMTCKPWRYHQDFYDMEIDHDLKLKCHTP